MPSTVDLLLWAKTCHEYIPAPPEQSNIARRPPAAGGGWTEAAEGSEGRTAGLRPDMRPTRHRCSCGWRERQAGVTRVFSPAPCLALGRKGAIHYKKTGGFQFVH